MVGEVYSHLLAYKLRNTPLHSGDLGFSMNSVSHGHCGSMDAATTLLAVAQADHEDVDSTTTRCIHNFRLATTTPTKAAKC